MNCTKEEATDEVSIVPRKKCMVDFLNQHCRLKGKKIPKYALDKLEEDELAELINSDSKLKAGFDTYVLSLHESSSPKKNVDRNAAVERFRKAAKAFLDERTSLLANMEFYEAINQLPYGSLPDEELHELMDKFFDGGIPQAAVRLLEYAVESKLKSEK